MTEKRIGSPLYIGIIVGVLLIVLIAVLVFFGLQVISLSGRLEWRNATLMNAVRDNTATLDFLKQNLMLLAQDSNEARGALRLPERDYPVLHPPASEAPPPADTRELFLNGLDTLIHDRDRQVTRERFAAFVSSAAIGRLERTNGLRGTKRGDDSLVLTKDGRDYFAISVDPVSRNIRVTDFLGRELVVHDVDSRMEEFLRTRTDALDRHYAKLAADLHSFELVPARPEVKTVLTANDLTVGKPTANDIGYSMSVHRASAVILTATLNARSLAVVSGDHRYSSVRDFAAGFASDLRKLDLSRLAEERVAAAQRSIVALKKDKTFMLALSSRRIAFSTVPRQDIDYYYYDFTDADGKRIGSFAVQKKLGTIYLMDSQGVPISALKTLEVGSVEGQKKN